MSNEKGSFSAEISQTAIDEALKSVERRQRSKEAAPEATEAGDVASPEVPVELSTTEVVVEEPAAPAATSGEVEELRVQLELSMAKGREMMEKVKESHERMLRAAADLENFKKRAQREREEAQRFGIEKLLKDFLPVMDNFERALEHAAPSADSQALLRGVQMTRKQFEAALGKHGVKGFSAVGEVFDPRLHEAMSQQESELPPNHVVSEMARGFFLHDRLIRPALVVVSAPRPEAQTPSPAPADVAPAAPASGGPEAGETRAADAKDDAKEGAA